MVQNEVLICFERLCSKRILKNISSVRKIRSPLGSSLKYSKCDLLNKQKFNNPKFVESACYDILNTFLNN